MQKTLMQRTSFLILPIALAALVLMGQGCPGAAPSGDDAMQGSADVDRAAGVMIGDLPSYEAPSDWGTGNNPNFTYRFPPEYTSDLDFETRETVVVHEETDEELLRIQYFDSEEPLFMMTGGDQALFDQIVGSAKKK